MSKASFVIASTGHLAQALRLCQSSSNGWIAVPATSARRGCCGTTSAWPDTIRRLRLLGVAQSQSERVNTTTYRVDTFGLRYQLSGINAAIGLAQLDRFDTTEHARRRLWRTYQEALAPLDDVMLVDVDPDCSVPHLCQIRVPHRDQVFADLRAQGIGVGVHYPPNHLQPAFATWRRPLPATEQAGKEILSLPFHQHLTEADIDLVISALGKALASPGRASCASC